MAVYDLLGNDEELPLARLAVDAGLGRSGVGHLADVVTVDAGLRRDSEPIAVFMRAAL